MKKAIVTGVTGQDGAYLSKFLIDKGYRVHGAVRRSSSRNLWRLNELGVVTHPNFRLEEYDLTDSYGAIRLLERISPDEIYNLAAQSFVGLSFEQPVTTAEINGFGTLNLLEAIRTVNPKIKFYQASTSEMFGKVQAIPQSETTPFYPRSPYGVSKLFAHWATINYRETYNIFGSCGILFNHESPLRGLEFVTRKITHGVAMILNGKLGVLQLGNLEAKRDWGYAGDYVEGMWRILQASNPDTFVLATNKTSTVKEFVKTAFEFAGIDIEFIGEGVDSKGIDKHSGRTLVSVNPDFYRPCEVDLLVGDAGKAKKILGWEHKVGMRELCKMMVEADIKRVSAGRVNF